MKLKVLSTGCILVTFFSNILAQVMKLIGNKNKDYEVAVYYFPQWHVDSQNIKTHGYAWTEWETLKNAKRRIEGHQQPKVPLWGYEEEADPKIITINKII